MALADGRAAGGHHFHGFGPRRWATCRSRTGRSLVTSPVSPRLCQEQLPWAGRPSEALQRKCAPGRWGGHRSRARSPGGSGHVRSHTGCRLEGFTCCLLRPQLLSLEDWEGHPSRGTFPLRRLETSVLRVSRKGGGGPGGGRRDMVRGGISHNAGFPGGVDSILAEVTVDRGTWPHGRGNVSGRWLQGLGHCQGQSSFIMGVWGTGTCHPRVPFVRGLF